MARKTSTFRRFKKRLNKLNLQSYLGLVLGAIIVIVLGFLVASFLTRNPSQGEIAGGEKTVSEGATAFGQMASEYKVKDGDTLYAIAESSYGDGSLWPALVAENEIENPDLIFTDATLKMPTKERAAELVKTQVQTSWDVVEGNTLSGIAESVYGDSSRWMEIAKANSVGYLENGNPLIFAGSTIKIPR